MARDAETLARVGDVLLEGEPERAPLRTLLLAKDAFALAAPESAAPLRAAADALRRAFAETSEVEIGTREQPLVTYWLRVWSVEVRECWALHGEWITRARPRSRSLDPANLLRGVELTPEAEREACARFARLRAHVRALVRPGAVLCLPTSAGPAPLRSASHEERVAFVHPSLCLCSVAGAGGLPQLQIPVDTGGGPPLGISLVAAPGADEALLAHAAAHFISPPR
jgi:amidase